MLDLWDRHGVKVTSHMIGEAAQRHPDLARAPSLLREGRQAASNAAFRAARANRRVGWIPDLRRPGALCRIADRRRLPLLC